VGARSLAAFWALAFLVTWGAGALVAVSTQATLVNGVSIGRRALPLSLPGAIVLLLVSGSGPAIAAIVVSAAEAGLSGVRALLSQVLRWQAGLGWYAIALLLPTALTLVSTAIWVVATGARPVRWLPLPTAFQVLALPLLPWGEEIGWRGFAQPRLQAGLPWLPASSVVGVMWGVWHQWPLLTPATNGLDFAGLGIFFVYIVSAAVIIVHCLRQEDARRCVIARASPIDGHQFEHPGPVLAARPRSASDRPGVRRGSAPGADGAGGPGLTLAIPTN